MNGPIASNWQLAEDRSIYSIDPDCTALASPANYYAFALLSLCNALRYVPPGVAASVVPVFLTLIGLSVASSSSCLREVFSAFLSRTSRIFFCYRLTILNYVLLTSDSRKNRSSSDSQRLDRSGHRSFRSLCTKLLVPCEFSEILF